MLRKVAQFFIFFLATLILTSCYYSFPNKNDHWAVEGAGMVDSVNFYIAHHYWTGYNFQTIDSLELYTAPPLAGLPDYGAMANDTIVVKKKKDLVVARVVYVPSDTLDSVWVKVAHNQLTQGWIRESNLLKRVTPNDPISKFIYHFSTKRSMIFFALIVFSLIIGFFYKIREKKPGLQNSNKTYSFYSTLLCMCVSFSAMLYGSMQKFVPTTWIEFYYHPTLNPFHAGIPTILALFIGSVWAILIASVAEIDEIIHQHSLNNKMWSIFLLIVECEIIYIIFTLTIPLYIGYGLFIIYWIFCIARYWKQHPSHLVCGACGKAIPHLGRCPSCGANNK